MQHKNTELLTLKRTTTVEYSACLCTLHTTLHALHTNSIGHCSLSAHTSKVLPLHRGAGQGEEADGYDLAGIDSSFHTLSTRHDNDDCCDVDNDGGHDDCDDERHSSKVF